MAERDAKGDGVDACGGEIFPEHDGSFRGWKREEQLVGALFALVGPQSHAQRWHEEEQQVRERLVQLVEIREAVEKESRTPECGGRAQQHEQRDEHVADRITEIPPQVTLGKRADHPIPHRHQRSPAPTPASSRVNSQKRSSSRPC